MSLIAETTHTALVFPGQGSQRADMRELVERQCPDLIELAISEIGSDPFERVSEGTSFQQPALYLAGPDAYLRAIHALDDAPVDPLMLVGHNPDMEDLIVLLTGQAARMPTAALAVIALDVADWSQVRFDETAKLVNVWRPRELA